MTDNPKRIYLQPECCADPEMGRLWCEDPNPVDCSDGVDWAEYTLTDRSPAGSIYTLLQAEDSRRVADALTDSISNMENEFAGMCAQIQSIIWAKGN